MDKDNLWTRRSNTSKLSLSTSVPATNGSDHASRNYTLGRRHGDNSSHSNRNPFAAMSPSTSSLASPTAGASSAFGLGSGAFASFGSAKTPKTSGGALDFGSIMGTSNSKTPVAEKQLKDLGYKASKTSLNENTKPSTPTHSLRDTWVFWYRPPIPKANGYVVYEKTVHAMVAFDTVEDFFAAYKHLKRPSDLPLVSDYHIFKKGIRPVWEDEENKKGGKWTVRLKKGVADRYWEDLLFAIIGDQFIEASDEVCGAVLSVRSGEDILSIWTRVDGGRVLRIRETMKRILAFPPETKVEWKSHDSSIQQKSAADDARKDKTNNYHGQGTPARNGTRENEHSSPADKK